MASRETEPVTLTVVVPSRNEEGSVDALVSGLERALRAHAAEVIFVDDSDDATPARVAERSRVAALPVRLLHRPLEERCGGLGGAVTDGLRAARGEWVCVLDADLQHPPATVPQLLEAAETDGLDLVIATRFRDGGSDGGLGTFRRAVSHASAAAARTLFPRRLRGVSDPMSGFFLVRRSAVETGRLKPNGFKILLEVLVRGSFGSVGEVPYVFAERRAGESKASPREGMRFLVQLARLRSPDATGRLVRFGLIGLSGLVVNEALLALFTERARLHYLVSAVISTQTSILWNFALTERWVYAHRSCRFDWKSRLVAFCLVCTTAQVLTTPMLYLLVDSARAPYLLANLFAIAASTLVRFTVAERMIWKRRSAVAAGSARS